MTESSATDMTEDSADTDAAADEQAAGADVAPEAEADAAGTAAEPAASDGTAGGSDDAAATAAEAHAPDEGASADETAEDGSTDDDAGQAADNDEAEAAAHAAADADATPDRGDEGADDDGADADEVLIPIPSKARLAEAEALVPQLRDLAQSGGSIVFDASAVEEITTPYVLTLVSFLGSLEDSGGRVAVSQAPTAFVDAFSDLGLFQDLMKMEFRT